MELPKFEKCRQTDLEQLVPNTVGITLLFTVRHRD